MHLTFLCYWIIQHLPELYFETPDVSREDVNRMLCWLLLCHVPQT